LKHGTKRNSVGTTKPFVAVEAPTFVPRRVAPWPWATTEYNWSEKRKQFEAKRLLKSEAY